MNFIPPTDTPPPPPANLGSFQINPPPPTQLPAYTHSTPPPAKSFPLLKWIFFAVCLSLITGVGGFFLGLSSGAELVKDFTPTRGNPKINNQSAPSPALPTIPDPL